MTIFDQVRGQKQTNEDFEPAPAEIETGFGALDFELQAFPTEETARKLRRAGFVSGVVTCDDVL